ncbi:MAG: DUF1501 domain-containing protein [Pseudomonadota bacterium]
MANINRRRFVTNASALTLMSSAGILGSMSQSRVFAADTSGYKALVCIFLFGGLDHADTLLPYDAPSHALLRNARPAILNRYQGTGASREISNLTALTPVNAGDFGGRQFALAPELDPLRALFQSGDAAIVGNVGPLIEPTTRTLMEANGVELPPRLFSHNDQQSTWESLGVEGEKIGWGGKFVDAALIADPSSNPAFAAINTSGNNVFLAGNVAQQFRVGSGGANPIQVIDQRSTIGRTNEGDAARDSFRSFLGRTVTADSNYFITDATRAIGGAIANNDIYNAAYENAVPLTTVFPETRIGRQLRAVVETIDIAPALNVNRQVFLVGMGGYDTHSNQTNSLPALLGELAEGIAAFSAGLSEINRWNDVVGFTASDFGRTVIDNGDGTDHGWGAHHVVFGGDVIGQRIYGEVPDLDLSSERYTERRARLIPSVSVEQYAATLGSWFGLDSGELAAALPNLGNFNQANLGFLS